MLFNNKKHIFLHVFSFFGIVTGIFVPVYGTICSPTDVPAEYIFHCPKNNHACAHALAEFKRDFAEQQKVVMQLFKAEPYLTTLSAEEIARRGCGVLNGLQSIKIIEHGNHVEVSYQLEKNNTYAPYSAFLHALNKALLKSRQSLLGLMIKPKNNGFARQTVQLDDNGSYLSVWWHIFAKFPGGIHAECVGIILLAELEKVL